MKGYSSDTSDLPSPTHRLLECKHDALSDLSEKRTSRTTLGTHSRYNSAMFLSDGVRRIDYVLAYETERSQESTDETRSRHEKRTGKRSFFEANLCQLGLRLERIQGEHCNNVHFVLVHAPFGVLLKQAELLQLKMPINKSDVQERTIIEGLLDRFLSKFRFLTFDEQTADRMKEPNYFTAPFIAQHLPLYVGSQDEDTFFESSERSRMVYDLLLRTRYDPEGTDKYRIGIERLVAGGTYTAAYPLHESCEEKEYNVDTSSNRGLLYWNWCRYNNCHKYQPLTLIRKYFGSKIGIYFAWLGYYTKVLFPAAVMGVLCFLYGLSTFSQDIPSNDICGSDGIGAQVMMCPACALLSTCPFTALNSSCVYSKLSYVFDNNATVLFAALMSVGATLFLEGWKRYHAELAWKWGLLDFEIDEEAVRPEYQLRIKESHTKHLNPITQQMEPYIPLRQRLLRFVASGVTVLFFLLLVLAFVVGVVVYRVAVAQVLRRVDSMEQYASIVTFVTASAINLMCIIVIGWFYTYLALKLTDWECPRTQAEFDNSYTIKVFLFQFINYYSSLFYIAFIKGNILSVPGQLLVGLRPEECDPAGCMVELVIQLAIVMGGKQFCSAFVEIAWPVVIKWMRSASLRVPETKAQRIERLRLNQQTEMNTCDGEVPRWERDYVLNAVGEQFLFNEYLEMVIQFGFVTLFVCAFPLAPFFALCNNVLEIRLDAYKFTIPTRRPMPQRAKDIGIWLPILDGISKLAVLINAFVIAFTSDFVPKLVYRSVYGHADLYGYVNDSLSVYDASSVPSWHHAAPNITTCRFRDYRHPPCGQEHCNEYAVTEQWWIVLAARLAFVLVFEHVVFMVKDVVAYVIPDVPSRIFIQLQRQRFLARQARLADMGNALSAQSLSHAAASDRDAFAFQPGLFRGDDERPSEPTSSSDYVSCTE